MAELNIRQQRERELHDRWAREFQSEELLIDQSFEAITAQENRFILKHFGPLQGKRVLDLGAGSGEASLYFASHGADVVSVDISPGQLELLAAEAAKRGLKIETHAIAAETLPFPDQSFDLLYGSSVLHHVDIRKVIPEVHRILKPSAKFAFIDPLAYNPAIWLYRRMASEVRTPDETPLTRRDIAYIISQFKSGGHREFWIAALSLFVYFWLIERVSPSKERYWKKIFKDGHRYGWLVKPLFAIDQIFTRIPLFRMLAWNCVIYGER